MKPIEPHITWRDVETIRPYPQNTKTHPASQIDRIAQSIQTYGMDVPLVIDRDGVLIKGHGRWLALKKLGHRLAPTITREDLTPDQVRAARVADNRAAISDFDLDALALEVTYLDDQGFDIGLVGFTDAEFSDLLKLTTPTDLEDIDAAGKDKSKPDRMDETADWPKVSLKVPPEVEQVYLDLLARAPGAKPHEKFEALLSAVDIMALEELARAQQKR